MSGPEDGQIRTRIDELPVVTLNPGSERVLRVRSVDSRGRTVISPPELVWSSSNPARVTVDTLGRVRGLALGQAWLYIRDGSGVGDSVSVWVERPASEASRFVITLVFEPEVPEYWREALETAADRWQQVIRDTLPAVDIALLEEACGAVPGRPRPEFTGIERGTRIYVGTSDGFPPGTFVEAVGGPCRHRGLPNPTTALGEITLNVDHFTAPPEAVRLRFVAHHEMGHTLGIAGIVQGVAPAWIDPDLAIYRGHLALDGARRIGHVVQEIDISNGLHWPFPGLMGTTISDRITEVSVGMLMDFGYPAAWYGAGPY